jgi:UDP-N-acetylenolpyruvoylglucosamine reductase
VSAGFVVREGELLARRSPWRIGGPCDAWIEVHARDGVADALALCRERGWNRTVIGSGSRTLFRDAGVAGAVVRLGAAFTAVSTGSSGRWFGAMVPLAVVGGRVPALAHLRAAPGSLGASVVLDPGWDGWVRRVRFVHRGGEREGDFDELASRGGGVVITEVLLSESGPGAPGPVDPRGWYTADAGVDVRASLASLGDVRLRSWLIPAEAVDTMVHLGGGTGKDAQLLQRSVMERVQREQGVKLVERLKWVGRAG